MIQAWRGYVNTLTYGLDLRRPAEDVTIVRRVDRLIEQRVFNGPVEDFYRAAIDAVTSKENLATDEYASDAIIRDYLSRVIALLDERRPWPEPPFYSLDIRQWSRLLGDAAPLIGRIPLSRRHLEERVNRGFTRVVAPLDSRRADADETAEAHVADSRRGRTNITSPGPSDVDILILHLRGGHVVGLKAHPLNLQQGIDVHANSDPAVIVGALRELVGLDVNPITSNSRG
jgi:hypothetical protein